MEDPAFTKLETNRLVIRRFREADAPRFAAYRNDPEIARYQGWDRPYADSKAREFIASIQDLAPGRPDTWFQFAVGTAESDLLIGDVALRTTPDDHRHAELGFSFAAAYQRHGYAAEAVRAVIDYAFTDLCMNHVFAITDSRNVRAQRLLERLAFRLQQKIGQDALLYSQLDSERHSEHVV